MFVRSFRRCGSRARLGFVLALLLFWVPGPSWAATSRPKTDVVMFEGGNILICEVKQLDRGKLRVKTSDAGTIDIEWEHVESVQSVFTYEVELRDGERFYGFPSKGAEPRTLVLTDLADVLTFDLHNIVGLTPIRKGFLGRIDGSLSLGFSFAQANSATNLNFDFDASLRSRKYLRKMSISSIVSDQEDVDRNERDVASFEFSRFLTPRWSAVTNVQGETNQELNLDLRSSVGGGARRQNIQTNSMLLSTVTGLAVNQERYSTEENANENLEAILSVEFEKFSFDTPQIDFDASFTVFPSLSEWGRVRAELDLKLRRELMKDFFLDLSAYDSYDSAPPGSAEATNDWGFTTALGWSF